MFKKLVLFYLLFLSSLFSRQLITPIPLEVGYDHKKAVLGEKLFFDTKLSRDNTISCGSCHFLEDGGDDNIEVAIGIDGKKGTRNTPTVLNARYNSTQFWDGSAKNLQDQAKGPIHNPVEMGSNFDEIISKLNKDQSYIKEFSNIYSDGITSENITDAIAEFEKTLTTPNSRFDQFLRGKKNALSEDEFNGYIAFKEYGCISCHNGINIGGNLIQKIGILEKYNTKDMGKFHITKNEDDKYYFKVPSLRNIDLTAPYFHDGKTKNLEEVVLKMVEFQVGFVISDREINNIVKFLKTLTGETPIKIIKNSDEKSNY